MAMRGFRPQKVGQYLHRGALALKAGGDRIVERARHALEPKPAPRLDHVMPLHRRSSAGRNGRSRRSAEDRKSVEWGKSVSVRVDLGGRRIIKKKKVTV